MERIAVEKGKVKCPYLSGVERPTERCVYCAYGKTINKTVIGCDFRERAVYKTGQRVG